MKAKYHNKKTSIDGVRFDSQKEARRYVELAYMQKAGEIKALQIQVPYVLIKKSQYGRAIKYIADFVYIKNGRVIVEDVKSAATKKNPVYRLKRRLMQEVHGITIKEV